MRISPLTAFKPAFLQRDGIMGNCDTLDRITAYYGKYSSWPKVGRAVAVEAVENGQIYEVTDRDANRYQALSHALYHGRIQDSPTLRRALGIRKSDSYAVAFHLHDESTAVALRRIFDRYGRNRREVAEKLVSGELRIVESET